MSAKFDRDEAFVREVRGALQRLGQDYAVPVVQAVMDRLRSRGLYDMPVVVPAPARPTQMPSMLGVIVELFEIGDRFVGWGELAGDSGRFVSCRGLLDVVDYAEKNQKQVIAPRGTLASLCGIEHAAMIWEVANMDDLRSLAWQVRNNMVEASDASDFVDTPEVPELSVVPTDVRDLFLANRTLLLVGQPGVGRTMIARRLPYFLPPMTAAERRAVATIHSRAGIFHGGSASVRPFRAPHHTVSELGLRSEVELARHGVLFLDEVSEFRKLTLQAGLDAAKAADVRVVMSDRACVCGWAEARGVIAKCICSQKSIDEHRKRWPDRAVIIWLDPGPTVRAVT